MKERADEMKSLSLSLSGCIHSVNRLVRRSHTLAYQPREKRLTSAHHHHHHRHLFPLRRRGLVYVHLCRHRPSRLLRVIVFEPKESWEPDGREF